MNNWLFGLYATLLAIVSLFTGEIVTFIMLGFILLALNSIHSTLKKLLKAMKEEME